MTPDQETKLNKIHDTMLVMCERWDNHLINHPKQPCDDMKQMKRDIWKAAVAAILALLGVVWQFLIGTK